MKIFAYIADRKKVTHTNYYVSPQERKQLIKECGVHGLVLYEYFLYLAKQTKDISQITDERTCHWFGWNIHTAARHRRALIKHGWYLRVKPPQKGTTKVEVYYLGKEAVREAQGNSEPQAERLPG